MEHKIWDNKIFVEGVWIELTTEQTDKINREKKKRITYSSSFDKMLRHLGFTKSEEQFRGGMVCYENEKYNWWAELTCHNERWYSVWVVGKGFPTSGMPGGKIFDTPGDLEKYLLEVMHKIENQ